MENLSKIIYSDVKTFANELNEIIDSFKKIFSTKYDISIIDKKFLKSLEEKKFQKLKNDVFKDIKYFLIKPLYKIFKLFFKIVLGKDRIKSFEESTKDQMKNAITKVIHKIIFKLHKNFYEITSTFLHTSTKDLKQQLKSQQFSLSLKKYENIYSFDVDKEFSFSSQTQSTNRSTHKEIYQNAIEKLNTIEKKFTPLEKLDIISKIHQKIWGSIVKTHQSHDGKMFMELRAKLDADNLISLYSYVIFNSKNYHLHKEIAFIEEFLDEKMLNNYEYLYYYEMFKSALEYITKHISENSD